jgi:hypothetical protein
MRLRSFRAIRGIGASTMLVAVAAFLLQTAMIIVSQAAASTGSMPHPAVIISGAIHFHDNLAGNIHTHTHADDDADGHVHTAPHADHHHDDHDDVDEPTNTPLWSFGCTSAVLPAPSACAIPVAVGVTAGEIAQEHLAGVEPDGLIRPPSTPSIA